MWAVISTILSAIMPLIAKLITEYLKRNSEKERLRKSFLEFLAEAQEDTSSARMQRSYNKQIKKLQQIEEEESNT